MIEINEIKTDCKIVLADTFLSRLKGLMFLKKMDGFDGMLLSPCNSIHTFFMKFPIDVYFLDKNYQVIKIYENLGPWRITPIKIRSHFVLETKVNLLNQKIRIGDRVNIKCINWSSLEED